jgi:uncharacterized YccA/Bax inhibitor family protein
MFRSGNPVLNSNPFQHPGAPSFDPSVSVNPAAMPTRAARADVMTLGGTTVKTFMLLAIVASTAFASWNFFVNNPGAIMMTMLASIVLGLGGGFMLLRMPKLGWLLAPVFALGEGAFVAAVSVLVVTRWVPNGGTGLIMQAAGLTFAIAAAMLALYGFRIVRLSGTAIRVIMVMTAGVGLYYLLSFGANMLGGLFGASGPIIPQLGWEGGWLGIGFSAFVVVLASLNLVMDFQMIEDRVRAGAPKHVEWLGAFALMTTLVWLYIEVLRLLAKLRNN